jgi:superfamily II DNA or RNA helicase
LGRKGVVDDIVAKYGYLIMNECHHISARSFEIVVRQCEARYITGLSATVTCKDGHHSIIFMNCGSVRFKTDNKKQLAKRPFAHKVILRETNF